MSWGKLRHNACSRCRGTMYREKDRYGTFLQCLQCGNIIDLDTFENSSDAELVAKLEKRTGTRLPKREGDAVGTH